MTASRLLDLNENDHWKRIDSITSQGPFNLMNTINNYMATLSTTQHDTYTDPFEIVTSNIGGYLIKSKYLLFLKISISN